MTKLGQPEVVLGPKVMWIILTSYVKRDGGSGDVDGSGVADR